MLPAGEAVAVWLAFAFFPLGSAGFLALLGFVGVGVGLVLGFAIALPAAAGTGLGAGAAVVATPLTTEACASTWSCERVRARTSSLASARSRR